MKANRLPAALFAVVFTIFCFTDNILAQEQVDGFLGVPFRTSKERVKSIIKKQEGLTPVQEGDTHIEYAISNAYGKPVEKVIFLFHERKLFSGIVQIATSDSGQVLVDEWRSWIDTFTVQYGQPDTVIVFPEGVDINNTELLRKHSISGDVVWKVADKTTRKPVYIAVGISSAGVGINIYDKELMEANEQSSGR